MERFVVVETAAELASLSPDHVLGNGSNLLAPDTGIPGTTVRLAGEFRNVTTLGGPPERVVVRVGAGVANAVLLSRLSKAGLAGAGVLAGVPGTMGGAVAMNAGTALGEISEVVVAVDGIRDGKIVRVGREQLPMKYREGGLPTGLVVTHVELALNSVNVAMEQERVATHLARRRGTQPLDLPSCGSVFRNPPGDAAGRLIESVGLKGFRVGDAQISERHANFIVNLGDAAASDVMRCIRTAWETVLNETGISLQPEVHVLGDWPENVWPFPGVAVI